MSCQYTQALILSAEVLNFDKSALHDFEAALLADTTYTASIDAASSPDTSARTESKDAKATNPAPHNITNVPWEKDENNHWHICTEYHQIVDQNAHIWNNGVVTTEPTSEQPGEKTFTCTVCSRTKKESIPPSGGSGGGGSTPGDGGTGGGGSSEPAQGDPKDIHATDTVSSASDGVGTLAQNTDFVLKDGGIDFLPDYTDTFTGERTVRLVIGDKYYEFPVTGTHIERIDINTLNIELENATYTGELAVPTVTAKNPDGIVIDKSNYDVAVPDDSIAVGYYTATITGKGIYTGFITITYAVNPPAKALSKVDTGKKSFTAKWKKASVLEKSGIDGFQVRYSTKKSMAGAKSKTAKKTAAKLKVKNLKGKKTYYVQMRTFKKVGENTFYSAWSTAKKVKTGR